MAESAQYPTSITTQLYDAVARKSTTLTSDITASDTTIPVASLTGFPDKGFIVIENETIHYGSKSVSSGAGSFTDCTRGYDGTAVSHTANTAVKYAIVAANWNRIIAEIIAMQSYGGGWTPAGETWTYASADDPTFTFTISGDKTDKYSAGMKIKLTQTTVKYFIITKVAYSDPNTTITIYGGTDYDLADAAITNPYYSTQKAPLGFPLDPDKWTVEVIDTENRTQLSPTSDTWYNPGAISIDIPIGIWRVYYSAVTLAQQDGAEEYASIFLTLSTTNNSESDSEFTTTHSVYTQTNEIRRSVNSVYNSKILKLSNKDTFYLNIKTDRSDVIEIAIRGGTAPTIIRAVCAYL